MLLPDFNRLKLLMKSNESLMRLALTNGIYIG